MNKEFIPYEQALALKELGFDELCYGRYIYDGLDEVWFLVQTQQKKSASVIFEGDRSVEGISTSAPLYQQAFRWFREKYYLHSYIEGAYPWFRFYINSKDDRYEGHKHLLFDEANLERLKKLIQIVKNK
jgi:hypothetical protein